MQGLKEYNDKTWFQDHRSDYVAHVVAPSRSFVAAMGALLKRDIGADIKAIPGARGRIGRINRDIRFGADKKLYNSHMQFRVWRGQPSPSPIINAGGARPRR